MKREKHPNPKKVLLALLPFWTPQIPPMGIACIKTYLNQNGFDQVKTVDLNTEMNLREIYDHYVNTLKEFTPKRLWGNFSSIVNDVWQNHMMAHIHKDDGPGTKTGIDPGSQGEKNSEMNSEYINLVRDLVKNVFFYEIQDQQVIRLNNIVEMIYQQLENSFFAIIEKQKPDVVGVSAFIGTLPTSIFALKITKTRYPEIMTVIGGGAFYDQLSQGTSNLEYFLEKTRKYIDKIVIGEGEILFLKLMKNEFPKNQRLFTRKDIQGEVVNLARVELPDISDFHMEHYPTVGAYTSRSCPFQCHFCSDPVMWGNYRKKKPTQIVGEFEQLWEKYGYQLFIMTDLLMNPIIKELSEELLENKHSFYFDGPMRVSPEGGKIENTFLWRRAGYYRAELGCESGSPRILKQMDKRITKEQTRATLTALAEAGIKTTTYWVIGFPGETEEDFQQTLDLVEELKDSIYEAMNNAFWYYPEGQVYSSRWREKAVPLYPREYQKMLLLQHWVLDLEPTREIRYHRVNRFVEHCTRLGIPDIFTLQELNQADERWKRLHRNAVPPLVEFKREGIHIDENKYIRMRKPVLEVKQHDGNWGF
jgi:radical SAM superfamily enzyme YgiQ (UPF0313 family)